MGSGKSGLGKKLAGMLGFDFADLDEMFEERYRISVFDFFEKYGEEYFRKMERDLLLETTEMVNTVISTGGGTPCFQDNMEVIRKSGSSVYLKYSAAELTERLKHIKRQRPLLRDIDPAGLGDWISGHLEEREKFYLQADYIFYPPGDDFSVLIMKIN
jgi:shikimate kinase